MPAPAISNASLVPLIHNVKKRVSRKQLTWLRHYIATGNATESARKAYRTSTVSAHQIGHENLQKLDYPQYLELSGVTDHLLISKLKDGLDANKIVSSMPNKDMASNDFVEVADHAVRHKYLETALKLKKRLDTPTVTVNIDKMLVLDGTDALDVSDVHEDVQEAQIDVDVHE